MRYPPRKSRDTFLVGHVTNQKYFIFTFIRRKANKLSRVVIRMRRPQPTCHVTIRSRHHVTAIQQIVYICSTSSWSSFLRQIIFKWLWQHWKCAVCIRQAFNVLLDVLLSSWVFSDRRADSVSAIIYFGVYIKSGPSRQTRHMFITTW